MTDSDLDTGLDATFQECLPDLVAGQGPVAAKLVGSVTRSLEAIESNDDETVNCTVLAKIRRILSTMTYRNALSVMDILDMIVKVQKRQSLQMLLDFLPALMENQEIDRTSEPVVSVLIDTCDRAPTARLPVLGCLSILPLTGEVRKASFQQAFKSLSIIDDSEWPLLIRILFRQVTEKGQAEMLWSTIRAQCTDIEMTDRLMLAAQFVFDAFRQDQKGALLRAMYLHCVTESEDVANILDIILLLCLSKDDEDPVDKIFDSWLVKKCFPFQLFEILVEQACGSNRIQIQTPLYQRIVDGLLRFAVFLLLTPARLQQCDTQPIVALVFQMAKHLDRVQQETLLSSLVHLSEETDGVMIDNKERLPIQGQCKPIPIFQPVNDVLHQIAQQSPNLLLPFKSVFMRRLSCDSGVSNPALASSVETVCNILVATSKASQDNCQELMSLLQRLLFLSTGGYSLSSDDSNQVVRGLLLARIMVDSSAASETEIEQIKEWVQKIMLPSTRRTIAPEVGRYCMSFLRALVKSDSSDSASKVYFEQFKMVLANTGLIQKLSQYKATHNNSPTVLAYHEIPSELASSSPENEEDLHFVPQDILFCVHYFLKRTDVTDPTRWECTCQWVFELVDTYLTLGRDNVKKEWTAEGWLQAAIEFSSVSFPSVSSTVDATLTDANDYSLYSPIRHDEGDNVDVKVTQEFIRMVCQYEIALLVAISLSLAVLKNASEHFRSTAVSGRSLSRQRLLLYQLIKLFHLKYKSGRILKLLRALKMSSKRKRQGNEKPLTLNGSRVSCINEHEVRSTEPVDAILLSISMAEKAAREIEKVHLLFFSESAYLSPNILWQGLQDFYVDNTILRIMTHGRCKAFDPTMVFFQYSLLEELAHVSKSVGRLSSEECYSIISCLVRSMNSLLDQNIRLRRSILHGSVDSQVYDISIQLIRGYVKLLSVFLTASEFLMESTPERKYQMISEMIVPCNKPKEQGVGDRSMVTLFEIISSQVGKTEDVGLAHFQLDILSCMATHGDFQYLDKSIEISWSALHSVFSGSIELGSGDWTRLFSLLMQRERSRHASESKGSLNLILEAVILSCRTISVKNFAPYCMAVIRHLALLSHTMDHLLRYSVHIVELVEEAESLAAALNSTIRGEKVEFNGKQRLSRPIPASSFPFLNSATLPDYFQTLLLMITFTLGNVDPALTTVSSEHGGPYQHLKFLLHIFRRLLHIFRDSFAIFPPRSTKIVSNISHDCLEIMILQLRRCVDWRNQQPILDIAQRTKSVDLGSLSYLDELIQDHMSPVIGDLSYLCDFFVERNDGPFFPFKRTNLRASIEKAGREIRKVAAVHNLSSPALLPRKLPQLDDPTAKLIMDMSSAKPAEHLDVGGVPLSISKAAGGDDDAFISTSESDDGSFGVSGEWGSSDDESSTRGVGIGATSLVKRS